MEFIINEKLENLKLPEPSLVNFYKNGWSNNKLQ